MRYHANSLSKIVLKMDRSYILRFVPALPHVLTFRLPPRLSRAAPHLRIDLPALLQLVCARLSQGCWRGWKPKRVNWPHQSRIPSPKSHPMQPSRVRKGWRSRACTRLESQGLLRSLCNSESSERVVPIPAQAARQRQSFRLWHS